ncbi:MAG: NAD(P)/FAD-dependent oxidoreductase [Planctomycetota bacterium]
MGNIPVIRYQTIVIGGGAAGLMAAISAGRRGQRVLIIEKNDAIGRKILVTGNGRCNLTNINITPNKYYGENTKCLHNIFSRFSHKETIALFEELGVRFKTEEFGRVLPVTDRASTVVDALGAEICRLKIKTNLGERVTGLVSAAGVWNVVTDKNTYRSECVILAAGGKSYPQLGSTGDGFDIARELGHRIIEPRPGLVPLELTGNWFQQLSGVTVNAEISLTVKEKLIIRRSGELLFTHFGISGPLVLDLSRLITDGINKPDNLVTVNFFPDYNSLKLAQFLNTRWRSQPQKTLANSLFGLMPKKLCTVLLAGLNLQTDTRSGQIPKKQTQLIAEQLARFPLEIKRHRPFAESMVTAGGVSLDEVNTRTMESLKAKGLYLAGEVLDIDGISGGYNLQFAWSTGYMAGLQL